MLVTSFLALGASEVIQYMAMRRLNDAKDVVRSAEAWADALDSISANPTKIAEARKHALELRIAFDQKFGDNNN